jgi:hypothetical protein
MDNVRDIVDGVLEAKGWRGRVLEQMAVELWPEVVGDTIARHTLAERFKSGTLYVRARSPQWTQELHFHQARVIARINGRLKSNLVQKIRCSVTPPRGIKVGALKPSWEDPTFPVVAPAAPNARPDRDDEAWQHAQSLCVGIEDDEMRATMEKMIASSLRAGKHRASEAAKKPAREELVIATPTPQSREFIAHLTR